MATLTWQAQLESTKTGNEETEISHSAEILWRRTSKLPWPDIKEGKARRLTYVGKLSRLAAGRPAAQEGKATTAPKFFVVTLRVD
jgi:hypothetical protein